jgi:hypothetical protein
MDGLKTPFADSIHQVSQQRASDTISLLGKALPCHVLSVSGQLVTVAFDVQSEFTLPLITMPIATSIYDWIPIQIGTKGLSIPSDVYLGGVSGLGGGTATLTQPGNLSALVFLPVSNSSWTPPGSSNLNQRVLQGEGGVMLQDMAGTSIINITPENISLNAGGHSIVINSNGVTIDGRVFLTHEHSGVKSGTNTTQGVV